MKVEHTQVGKIRDPRGARGQGWWWVGAGTVSLACVAAYAVHRRRRSLQTSPPRAAAGTTESNETASVPPPKQPVFPQPRKEAENIVLVSTEFGELFLCESSPCILMLLPGSQALASSSNHRASRILLHWEDIANVAIISNLTRHL